MNWESLISSRIQMHRDTYRPQRIEDPGKRNAANQQRKWNAEHPERRKEIERRHDAKRRKDPKRIAWQRQYDASPKRKAYHKQFRIENREEINARHRAYNASEKGRASNSRYNAEWREKNREYDRERKKLWWRRNHPNPNPVGRPRKNVEAA